MLTNRKFSIIWLVVSATAGCSSFFLNDNEDFKILYILSSIVLFLAFLPLFAIDDDLLRELLPENFYEKHEGWYFCFKLMLWIFFITGLGLVTLDLGIE